MVHDPPVTQIFHALWKSRLYRASLPRSLAVTPGLILVNTTHPLEQFLRIGPTDFLSFGSPRYRHHHRRGPMGFVSLCLRSSCAIISAAILFLLLFKLYLSLQSAHWVDCCFLIRTVGFYERVGFILSMMENYTPRKHHL